MTQEKKKRLGSSQEIKFQGPEETKRRVKKEVNQVDRKESEWDHWSEKFVALARARGFAGILLGTEQAPRAHEEIDRKKSDGSYELTDADRKEKIQACKWQCIHKFAVVI